VVLGRNLVFPDRNPRRARNVGEEQRVAESRLAGKCGGCSMLYWAVVFFIIAIVAGFLGFGGVASAASGIAQILFFVFLVVFLIALVMGLARRRPPTV
jgi:uncharacterized membrane protein YtjA (UPF0391 family)